ncbi:MAG: hypothetical protein J6S67_17055 [Methanobrevibacter sp.]|nr:hypothetical protein [Methanobrevibacter sp.]
MKREILTYNEIQGFHNYPTAPNSVKYLSFIHRHIFVIKTRCQVSHNEREIEIITQQDKIAKKLKDQFGYPCMFGNMSCESIAEWLLNNIEELTYVEVLEDGYGGAALTK